MLKRISPKLLYRRKTTAEVLDMSIDSVKRLEKRGLLTRVRPTGPRGAVCHPAKEVEALALSKEMRTGELVK